MSQCFPPHQRRGAGSPAPLQPLRGSNSLQVKQCCGYSFTRASTAPAWPQRDRGGGTRQPEPEAEGARATSRAVQSSHSVSQGERKILFKILTVNFFWFED